MIADAIFRVLYLIKFESTFSRMPTIMEAKPSQASMKSTPQCSSKWSSLCQFRDKRRSSPTWQLFIRHKCKGPISTMVKPSGLKFQTADHILVHWTLILPRTRALTAKEACTVTITRVSACTPTPTAWESTCRVLWWAEGNVKSCMASKRSTGEATSACNLQTTRLVGFHMTSNNTAVMLPPARLKMVILSGAVSRMLRATTIWCTKGRVFDPMMLFKRPAPCMAHSITWIRASISWLRPLERAEIHTRPTWVRREARANWDLSCLARHMAVSPHRLSKCISSSLPSWAAPPTLTIRPGETRWLNTNNAVQLECLLWMANKTMDRPLNNK